MIKARIAREYDREAVSLETALMCAEDEDMCQQQYAEDADINNIVRRMGLGGTIIVPRNPPDYGDWSNAVDFQTGMQLLRRAEEMFMELPASLREEFGHDAARFVDWVSDPANADAARERGLLPPESAVPGNGSGGSQERVADGAAGETAPEA